MMRTCHTNKTDSDGPVPSAKYTTGDGVARRYHSLRVVTADFSARNKTQPRRFQKSNFGRSPEYFNCDVRGHPKFPYGTRKQTTPKGKTDSRVFVGVIILYHTRANRRQKMATLIINSRMNHDTNDYVHKPQIAHRLCHPTRTLM